MNCSNLDNNNENRKGFTSGSGGGFVADNGYVGGEGTSGTTNGRSGGGGRGGDAFTVKRIMGRTPGLIKSKFLSVLDSSNGILNGISIRLEGFSLNSTTATTADEDIYTPQKVPIGKKGTYSVKTDTDTEAEDILIEIESRKLKERRAHEEIKSGRFRHQNILTKITDGFSLMDLQSRTTPACVVSPSTSSSQSTSTNASDGKSGQESSGESPKTSREATAAAVTTGKQSSVATTSSVAAAASAALQIDVTAPSDDTLDGAGGGGARQQKNNISCAISTLSTSDYDLCVPSSISGGGGCGDSTTGMWIRSESINSVPSWASTISLDSQTGDEAVVEFVRGFLKTLFDNPEKISLELKAEFGQVARTEAGRLWFSRLVNAQRVKSKRVDEGTFYSLITYFAIVLFECNDCYDYSPAKSLMNMCFTFYHEICVPGIEPYREYLYLYLRDQPIWHSLRFWNAAFFDALQCERANKPIPSTRSFVKVPRRKFRTAAGDDVEAVSDGEGAEEEDLGSEDGIQSEKLERMEKKRLEIDDDQRFHENITFGQLGTFTCNMHAFGLSRELCLEFLRKQCVIANLSAEHEKLLKDNIVRMYRETDKWRT